MHLLIFILLLISPVDDLNRIARINKHKKAAKEAYLLENYDQAAFHYRILVDSLGVDEEEVKLNLANTMYHINDTTSARNLYGDVIRNEGTPSNISQAHQQLGLMDFESKHYEEALSQFKESIKADPANEDARYNYELLKKLLKEQEQEQEQEQQQQQQNQQDQKDQENQDNQQNQQNQENQENQDPENNRDQDQQQQREEGEEQQQDEQQQQEPEEQQKEGDETEENQQEPQSSTADKLEEMNISEEKAQMILEAMKNNEIQYIQQNKRKAKNRKKSGKPDW